jgi:hypothetical protein
VPERQLSLAYGLGGVQQRLVDVLGGEARMLGEDLWSSHAVGEHRHYRRDREAQSADAGLAAHDSWVCGDAVVGHESMLAAAARPGTRRSPKPSR